METMTNYAYRLLFSFLFALSIQPKPERELEHDTKHWPNSLLLRKKFYDVSQINFKCFIYLWTLSQNLVIGSKTLFVDL